MHHQDTVPIFQCIAQVVRYHNRRHFLFPDDLIRQLHDNFRCSRIQCRRMLIQNQEINRCHRRHQKRQYLTLSAGKGTDLCFQLVFQPKSQTGKHLAVRIFPALSDTAVQSVTFFFQIRNRHIFQHRHIRARPGRRVLVYSADFAVAHIFFLTGDISSVYDDLSCVRRNAAADQVQHGGFAGAVAADHRHELAVWNRQVKILKQAHFID